MHPAIVLLALLLIGVNTQDLLEDIFDMNMGEPTVSNELCCTNANKTSEPLEKGKIDLTPDPAPSIEVPQGCGYRNEHGVGSVKIPVKEGEAKVGEFPWVVAILERRALQNVIEETYKCAGSLIHPKVVLTAAHNILTGKSSDYKVRAGEWEPHSRMEELPHQDRLLLYRIIHPRFNSRNLYFDIALLFLEVPFDLAPNINTICLPPPIQNVNSSPCYVCGWGIEPDSRQHPSKLKKSELTIRPNRQCERDLRAVSQSRFTLHSSFMCAGGESGNDACTGDGGAPLVCPLANASNRYYQTGIVSWGIGCGLRNVPGVYANLRFLRPWIDEELNLKKINSSFYTAE